MERKREKLEQYIPCATLKNPKAWAYFLFVVVSDFRNLKNSHYDGNSIKPKEKEKKKLLSQNWNLSIFLQYKSIDMQADIFFFSLSW